MQTGASLSFWTLKEERKDEKQQKQDSKKKSASRSFQASSLQTAPSPRHTDSIAYTPPPLSGPDSGRPLPPRESFQTQGVWAVHSVEKQEGQQTHLRGKGRRLGGSGGQRQVLVSDRATDDGHAHTVVEPSVRDSFTAAEAPNGALAAVRG